ncbi:MAG TPA: CidA/LrgA family protein [Burkholderiaceae bacterium]|nr:CidA/LrgA family protein [Burkholderiaceae bacterium]
MLYAIVALLLFQLLGEAASSWLNVPLPGALLGMTLLLLALIALGRTPRGLQRTAGGLLPHLMLLFIPSVVAVMTQMDYLTSEWLPFIVASLAGTAITIVVTAATLKFLLKRQQKPKC